MKQLLSLLLIMIAIDTSAQDKEKPGTSPPFKRIQIGVNFSPDACFRTLANNDGSAASDAVIQLRNDNETAKLGYTAGLNVCFNVQDFWGIETGIQYSKKGYQTRWKDLIFLEPEPGLPTESKFTYDCDYIDVPLRAYLIRGKHKVRFFTSAGITTNIFLRETQTNFLEYPDGRIAEKTRPTTFNYNRVNLSATISVGFDYKINSRMNLRVEPTFRHGFLKIIDTPVTGYLYSAGINVGCYFGLQ